jgi:hypothetical protein
MRLIIGPFADAAQLLENIAASGNMKRPRHDNSRARVQSVHVDRSVRFVTLRSLDGSDAA